MADTEPVEQDQPTQDPVDQPKEPVGSKGDTVSYDSYKKLLDEKKTTQRKLAEFETAQQKRDQEKLEEEGRYKELIEAKNKELEELNPYKSEAETYRSYFENELEKAKDGLTEVQKKAVDGFSGTLSEKLNIANEFMGSKNIKTSSPGSDRPGSMGTPKFDINDYVGIEGQKKLNRLYDENRELYNEVIKAKKNRA